MELTGSLELSSSSSGTRIPSSMDTMMWTCISRGCVEDMESIPSHQIPGDVRRCLEIRESQESRMCSPGYLGRHVDNRMCP